MYLIPVLSMVLAVVLLGAARAIPADIERLKSWMRAEDRTP